MSCLGNFIGVKFPGYNSQPGYTAPTSGMFINDLPGISVYSAGDVADQENSSGIQLLQNCITRAIRLQEDQLNELVSPRLKFVPLVDSGYIGDYVITSNDNDTPNYEDSGNLPTDLKGGVQIRIGQGVKAAKIRIESVDMLCDTTIAGRFFRISENRDVAGSDIFYFDAVANQVVTTDVNQTFDGPIVSIYSSIAGFLPAVSYPTMEGCNTCGGGSTKRFSHAVTEGYTLTDGRSSKTWGMRVNFSVICDPEPIICKLSTQKPFRSLMLYAAGIELAKEVMHSTRMNPNRVMSQDWAANMLDYELPGSWVREYEKLWKSFSESSARAIKQLAGRCACDNGIRITAGGF